MESSVGVVLAVVMRALFSPRSPSFLLLAAALLASGCPSSDSQTPGAKSGASTKEGSDPKNKKGDSTQPKGKDDKDTEDKGNGDKGEGDDKGNGDSEKDEGGDQGDDESESSPKFDMGSTPEPEEDKKDRCDMDFLFVIDNSASMGDIQKAISSSVPDFIDTVQTRIPDLEAYHIGVISTDEGFFNNTADVDKCRTLGGLTIRTLDLSRRPAESVCIPYANKKNFISNDDSLQDKFKCAAELGANGNGNERPMDALLASFSDELTKPGACNEGFFREKAILVVVIITDEEDDPRIAENGNPGGSKGDPKDWHKALTEFKKKGSDSLVVLSLVGTPEPNKCEKTFQPGTSDDGKGVKTAEIGARLIKFTETFGDRGVVGDVCADNFDSFFQKAVSKIELACDEIPR